jgi:putative cardiolipin synthase
MTISIGTSAFIVSWARGSVALLLSLLLSACGTLPTQVDRPFSPAQQPAADSPLVRIAQDSSPAPTLTGFRLLPDGFYSLDARIELARRARHSLDVQYYLIQDDRTGRLLMRHLRDAALRGVRVRLLVDDLYTAGGDPMFRGLAAFPNVEVRLFNPFCCARQNVVSRYAASIADFRRLNHRMHNKLFIADGVLAVMGGRNIADEYFTRSDKSNFIDMDVFTVGPVVRQLASIFDVYWNSPQAYPVEAILGESADHEEARRSFDHLVDDGEQMRSLVLSPFDILGYGPISDDLDAGRLGLVWGTAVAFADQPAKVMATSAETARSMSAQMNVMDRVMESKSEVVISAPYLIPGSMGVRAFGDLRKRNVKVTILTNSFAANDVPLAHAGYARYRVELLRTGIDIYELSPTRIQHNERLTLPGASLGRLHAKMAAIDQSTVYIGSVNLDPRSESTNTELGLFARCPELAKEVIRVINISKLQSSYRLRFAPDGQSLEWLATDDQGEVVLSAEPEVTPRMRLQNMLLAPFVPEQLL